MSSSSAYATYVATMPITIAIAASATMRRVAVKSPNLDRSASGADMGTSPSPSHRRRLVFEKHPRRHLVRAERDDERLERTQQLRARGRGHLAHDVGEARLRYARRGPHDVL